MQEIRLAESITGDKFATGSRINVSYCACADVIVMFETHVIGQTAMSSIERYASPWTPVLLVVQGSMASLSVSILYVIDA